MNFCPVSCNFSSFILVLFIILFFFLVLLNLYQFCLSFGKKTTLVDLFYHFSGLHLISFHSCLYYFLTSAMFGLNLFFFSSSLRCEIRSFICYLSNLLNHWPLNNTGLNYMGPLICRFFFQEIQYSAISAFSL